MTVALSQDTINKFVGSAHGDFKTVQKMLDECPDLLDKSSFQDETALEAAAHTGQKRIVEFLLERGASLDICTAALMGKAVEIRKMLAQSRDQITATGSHGIPLAYYAALGGHVEIAEILFEHGIDLNAGDGLQTALHAAVMTGNLPMAKWLIAHGARKDIKNYSGQTVCDIAAKSDLPGLREVIQ